MKTDGSLSNDWKRSTAILAVRAGGTPVLQPRPTLTQARAGAIMDFAQCLSPRLCVPLVLGLLTWLAASCGGVPKTYYYTLQMPAPPAARNDPKTTFVLGVEHFRAVDRLRDDRIVYYQSPTEMNFYEYHRWGSDPASMLTELALQWLQGTRAFADVRMLPTREPVHYVLRGRLFNFEEVDFEGEGKARVNLELSLVRTGDHRVVWSAQRLAETPVEEKGLAGVVRALNGASYQLLGEALPGLVAQVEQDYKASQGQTPEAENKHL